MGNDSARLAAVDFALTLVPKNATIGLGSGRAVFALIDALAQRAGGQISAVVASTETGRRAAAAGIQVMELNASTHLTFAFDGADEVDSQLGLVKGGGAALLREKLVIAAASRVVIMVEAVKIVDALGQTRTLPVEVVRFGWQTTQARLLEFVDDTVLRTNDDGTPVITDEGHFLLDVPIPRGNPNELADKLKRTLGVVDHGLFLEMATDVIVGHDDGSVTVLER